jgi:hypothetical protein
MRRSPFARGFMGTPHPVRDGYTPLDMAATEDRAEP